MTEVRKYQVGDATYVQRPVVLGQLSRLMESLNGIRITTLSATGLIAAVGPKLPEIMAAVLVPDGLAPAEVDHDRLAEELAWNMDPETALKVVEDFFVLTPVSSYLSKLTEVVVKVMRTGAATKNRKTGSKNSSASSRPETSQSAS